MLKKISHFKDSVLTKIIFGLSSLSAAKSSFALDRMDLTQDLSGGKTLEDVGENVDKTLGWGLTLFLSFMVFIGIVIVSLSLLKLHKATKDNSHESPASAIFGIVIGGLMTAVGIITFMVKGSMIGS